MIFEIIMQYYLVIIFFFIMVFIERKYPLREKKFSVKKRVLINLSFAFISFIIARSFSYPIIFIVRGIFGEDHFGILKILEFSAILSFIFSFIFLDYSQYVWHRINHSIPFFWTFHKVHHSDPDLDASTAFRFHFGEQFFAQFFRFFVIMLFAVQMEYVLIYDFISLFAIVFHHSNYYFKYDKILSRVIVTPSIHSIHHSRDFSEMNSNFSVVFSFWDRFHRSFKMTENVAMIKIGLNDIAENDANKLLNILVWPFNKKDKGS
ncbi:sterol desaturase family protein [Fluviispira sanaruensis]|uniref:Sterol desaturase n=1 Tax=Fluviispira sanaruensis TaxID=2493639 RepID=A0A4P2VNA8_FLUSA|nr:sterol desaturase family protein [Fluviispira sanaruensis]BBH54561.1 sterol desaturase [Fluviispira sanaruensis]